MSHLLHGMRQYSRTFFYILAPCLLLLFLYVLKFSVPGQQKQRLLSQEYNKSRTPSWFENDPLPIGNELVINDDNKEHLEDVKKESDEAQEAKDAQLFFKSSPHTQSNDISTMFSTMSTSFIDIKLNAEGGIPVIPFIDACSSVLLIFDKLNPTAFMPIKNDISGNIKKIKQKYSTDPDSFRTLQEMVHYEVENKQFTQSYSATVSLIWLKRAMAFIREFLTEVHRGDTDLESCAHNAYSRTLRAYHGFIIRSIFTLAAKSMPNRKDFLGTLAHTESDREKRGYNERVLQDIDNYITAQGVLIQIIDDYYISESINPRTLI